MNEKKKNNTNDPYKFEITGDFIQDGHNKISAKKSRIQTEAKIRKENKGQFVQAAPPQTKNNRSEFYLKAVSFI